MSAAIASVVAMALQCLYIAPFLRCHMFHFRTRSFRIDHYRCTMAILISFRQNFVDRCNRVVYRLYIHCYNSAVIEPLRLYQYFAFVVVAALCKWNPWGSWRLPQIEHRHFVSIGQSVSRHRRSRWCRRWRWRTNTDTLQWWQCAAITQYLSRKASFGDAAPWITRCCAHFDATSGQREVCAGTRGAWHPS